MQSQLYVNRSRNKGMRRKARRPPEITSVFTSPLIGRGHDICALIGQNTDACLFFKQKKKSPGCNVFTWLPRVKQKLGSGPSEAVYLRTPLGWKMELFTLANFTRKNFTKAFPFRNIYFRQNNFIACFFYSAMLNVACIWYFSSVNQSKHTFYFVYAFRMFGQTWALSLPYKFQKKFWTGNEGKDVQKYFSDIYQFKSQQPDSFWVKKEHWK